MQGAHPETGARRTLTHWGEADAAGHVYVEPSALEHRAQTPLLGTVFDGRYAIYDARFMPNSIIYFAAHQQLGDDRHVVIKRVRPNHPHEELAVRRLRQEARFLARLPKHPNLPQVHDLIVAGGAHYLVMERAPGQPLASLLKAAGTLSIERAAEVLDQMLAGLATCHAAGVVHRDLKPSNILVDRASGQIRVTLVDFGIAKSVGDGDVTDLGTEHQPGTPAYMSPEQAWNGVVTPASDLYSATAVFYRSITGTAPERAGEGPEDAALDLDITLGGDVRQFIETGLAVFPNGRFADAATMRRALAPLMGVDAVLPVVVGSATGTDLGTGIGPPKAPASRWPWAVVGLLAFGAAAVWAVQRPATVVEPDAGQIEPAADRPVVGAAPPVDAAPVDAAPLDARVDAVPAPLDAAPEDAAPKPRSRKVKRPRARPPAIDPAARSLADSIHRDFVSRCRCGPAYGAALTRLRALRGGADLMRARNLKACVHLFSPEMQRCVDGRPMMKAGP